jgi:hypothetical protein
MTARTCNAKEGRVKTVCLVPLRASDLRPIFLIYFLSAIFALPLHAAELKPSEEAAQAYEQAMTALSAGNQERAELLLERVLMLSPNNAEARIELASLFAKRGRLISAKLMLESLAIDPRTPEEHSLKLRRLSEQLSLAQDKLFDIHAAPAALTKVATNKLRASPSTDAAIAPVITASNRLEIGAANSSNPLARTGSEGISFTFPEGPVQLPLSVKPQRGVARTLLASHDISQLRDAGVELYVQSMQPFAAQENFNTGQNTATKTDVKTAFRISFWGALPTAQESLPSLQWHYQAQQGLDGLRRHSLSVAKPFEWLGLAWRGVAVHYQEPSTLDRQGDRGQAVRLEQKSFIGPWSLLAHAERSASQIFDQGYLRTGVQAEVHVWPNGLLNWQVSDQKDTHGYSPLLENGAKRRLISNNVAFEQQHQLEKEKVLIFRVFRTERRSKLELFNYKDVGAQILLRHLL